MTLGHRKRFLCMDEKKVITGGYTMGNTKVDERRYIGRFTILQEEMESAADLKVRLAAEVHVGKTWYDAKG